MAPDKDNADAAETKTEKAGALKDDDGNVITSFATYDDAAAQAKALGGKHRVESIGTAHAVVKDE